MEDSPGLAIDLPVGQKKVNLISDPITPPGFAPNGSDGYLTSFGIAKTISALARDSQVVIEVRFVCDDVLREENGPVYLVLNLNRKPQEGKRALCPLLLIISLNMIQKMIQRSIPPNIFITSVCEQQYISLKPLRG